MTLRSIPLSVLGLVASVAVAGAPFSVARDGRGPAHHHHFAGERGGPGSGHVQAPSPEGQFDQDQVQGSPHSGDFTLVSDGSGAGGLPDFSGDRPNHDRFEGPSSDGASGYGGGSRGGGSAEPGRSGGSDDGASGVGDPLSFGSRPTGFGGVGGFSGPSQNSKPGQGSDTPPPPNDGLVGNQGGDHGCEGGAPATYGFNNGAPQTIGKNPLAISAIAGVPEPSAWMMMLVGVGAVGAALRRHRGHARPRRAAVAGA